MSEEEHDDSYWEDLWTSVSHRVYAPQAPREYSPQPRRPWRHPMLMDSDEEEEAEEEAEEDGEDDNEDDNEDDITGLIHRTLVSPSTAVTPPTSVWDQVPNATPEHLLVCRYIDECSARTEKAPPEEFFCPISHAALRDPVTTKDGHLYDRLFIHRYTGFASTWISPMTGVEVSNDPLHPCKPMLSLMERWVRADMNIDNGASLHAALRTQFETADVA